MLICNKVYLNSISFFSFVLVTLCFLQIKLENKFPISGDVKFIEYTTSRKRNYLLREMFASLEGGDIGFRKRGFFATLKKVSRFFLTDSPNEVR